MATAPVLFVPMVRFFEPCWKAGKAVRWGIHRHDGEPFTVTAIWDSWTDRATGEIVELFSMLTINADGHPVIGRFHRPGDERRSLVVVPPNAWHKWLGRHQACSDPSFKPLGFLLAAAEKPSYRTAMDAVRPGPEQSALH